MDAADDVTDTSPRTAPRSSWGGTSDGPAGGARRPSGCGCRCGPPTTSRAIRAGARSPWLAPAVPARGRPSTRASLWRDGDPWSSRVDHARRTWPSGRSASSGRPQPAADGTPRGRDRLRPGRGRPGRGLRHRGAHARWSPRPRRPACGSGPASQPDNAASIRVLAKCGFTELRGSNEDGELVMARPLRVTSHGWSPPTSTAPWSAPTAPSPTGPARCSPRSRRGVPVVFVTGRPLRWAEEVFEHVGSHGLGRGLQRRAGLGRRRRTVHGSSAARSTPETVRQVCGELRAAVPGSAFAVETLDGIGLEPEFMERHPVPDGARRAPIDELLDGPVVKLLARHEELGPQDYWDAAEAAVGERVTITWSSTARCSRSAPPASPRRPTLALLARRARRRRGGRDRVRRHAQRPADAGVGRHVVRHGERATRRVLAAVDHVAPSNDEDGVARCWLESSACDLLVMLDGCSRRLL